jgi:hypothetical protein
MQAQLPDGSIAPDFTLTDLNGTTHNLHSLLDNGYTVFLDFSAVWCPPCWSYHTGGTLEDLYENHGPSGYPGVSPNTSDDVMVFMIEGDGNTTANLAGSGGNTQGDWITGTLYPIICTDGTVNNTQVTSDYQIAFWPTIYMVCPNRIVTEVGQSSTPYNSISSCPPPASYDNDASTFDYSGETLTCEGDITPEITVQNYGLVPLTNMNVDVSVNGNQVSSTPWTGNLATYAVTDITLPALSGLSNTDLVSINVTQPNGVTDANTSNNETSFYVTTATANTDLYVTVSIVTDAYGSETTWDIKDDNGTTVLSGGPYNNLTAAGVTAQTPATTTLSAQTCHTFTIYDSYGDGMDAGYGNGSYTVTDGAGTILASGGQFTDEDGDAFKTGNSSTTPVSFDCIANSCVDPGTGAGVFTSLAACNAACGSTEINETISKLSIYPNPVQNVLSIQGLYNSVDMYDVFGKLVMSSGYEKTIDVSLLVLIFIL